MNMLETRKYGITTAMSALCLAMVALPAQAGQKTFTTNTDFNSGTNDGVTSNGGSLILDSTTGSTFPVLWVSNAGDDTVSKIDTQNNVEVARYRTWFDPGFNHGAYSGPAPSRTAVDTDGNVFVANRHFDSNPAMVLKILSSGGIDRNGNGVIDTSSGSAPINLVDSNGNGKLDNTELADERVAWVAQVGDPGQLGRSLCIDTQGDVWVGLYYSQQYYELDANTGAQKSGPHAVSWTPYGCAVDKNGILWSASLGDTTGRLDTNNPTDVQTFSGGSYGIAIGNGKIYSGGQCAYTELDPATGVVTNRSGVCGSGISVDGDGNIVTGYSQVGKYNKTDGSEMWVSSEFAGYGVGVVVDGDNHVWQIDYSNNVAKKFDKANGNLMAEVPVGNYPYTYSDATGIAARTQTTTTGFWTAVLDGGANDARWNKVCWNVGALPAGSEVGTESRASNTQAGLDGVNREPRQNCVPLLQVGRFLELRAKLAANTNGDSPSLDSISAQTKVCDVDLDNDIDTNDLNLIRAAMNANASSFADPRDADGDGKILVNDVRTCTLQCTKARCAL